MAARKKAPAKTQDELDAEELDRINAELNARLSGTERTDLGEREAAFQQWVRQNRIGDVDHPDSFYDYRGYWNKYGNQPHQQGAHFTDEFKQHGHPAFSEESNYARGFDDGGHWVYGPGGVERVMPTAPVVVQPNTAALDDAAVRLHQQQVIRGMWRR